MSYWSTPFTTLAGRFRHNVHRVIFANPSICCTEPRKEEERRRCSHRNLPPPSSSPPNRRSRQGATLRFCKMDEFNFTENSREMFDKVCASTPWFVRHFTRNGLVKGLEERGCGDVTEMIMYDVCKQVTPPKYLERTLKILEECKTKT